MGTRGHLGGLAEATLQALLLVDASGKDVVFLETVGTGQSEVEVIGIADLVLLVLMPGSGDAVQALKAGIMEIPDVIAVNKMDHPAAKTMVQEVRSIVALDPDRERRPAILLTEALRGEGDRGALGRAREAARRRSRSAESSTARRERNLSGEVEALAVARIRERVRRTIADGSRGSRARGRRAAARGRPADGGRRRRGGRDGAVRMSAERPGIDAIREARERLDGVARVTPVYSSETLSRHRRHGRCS